MYKTQNNLYFLNLNSRISCRDRGCRTIAKIPSCHICRKNKKEAQSNIKDQLKRESETWKTNVAKPKSFKIFKCINYTSAKLIVMCIFWSFHTYIYVNRQRQTQHNYIKAKATMHHVIKLYSAFNFWILHYVSSW